MFISLNYLIFALALYFSIDLSRRSSSYRDAATHMLLFAIAALLGGIAHHIHRESVLLQQLVAMFNAQLPYYFHISRVDELFTRVWFITYIAIGFTEYYFMRIFLHPLADAYHFKFIKHYLKILLIVFCSAALFIREYSLVVSFHLLTHLLVIGFCLNIIFIKGQVFLWKLMALVIFNLMASLLWALMALSKVPYRGSTL